MRYSRFLMLSAFALLPAALLVFSLDTAIGQGSRQCSVLSVTGAPARVEAAGAWEALEVGPVGRNARLIATGPSARAELECTGGLIVTVGAATELDIGGLIGPAEQAAGIVLDLMRGMVGLNATNRSSVPVVVHTPVAVAAAEAGAWLVEYSPPTGAGVFVRSGQVDVTGRAGGAVQLSEGEGVTILPGASRVQVLRWSAPRIAGAGATLGFRWQ